MNGHWNTYCAYTASGHAQGACYEPTLLTDVPDDVMMSKEETFGPVATITIVDNADQAVDVANQTS